MKLLLLYGPPAVGKLTIARELADQTGFALFHNHQMLNVLSQLFGYESTSRKKLEKEFRQRILEQAAEDKVDMITTTGAVGPEFFSFYEAIIAGVEKHGGTVCLVHLTAPKQVLLDRVGEISRTKLRKIDTVEGLEKYLKERPGTFDRYPHREHLTVDTSEITPTEAVKKIVDYYELELS